MRSHKRQYPKTRIAEKRKDWSRECPSGKRGYMNRELCIVALKRSHYTGDLYPYECRHCGYWHMTRSHPRKSPP